MQLLIGWKRKKQKTIDCIRIDGILRIFFDMFWDAIFDTIVKGFYEMWSTKHMLKSIVEGNPMIYLIKKGTRETQKFKNWRPLTILNTIYKIYASVLE